MFNWILSNPELSAGILSTLTIIIGFIFAYKQLKNMAKDRHAQIILGLSNQWDSEVIQRARKALAKKSLEVQNSKAKDPEAKLTEMLVETMEKDFPSMIELMTVADFFEDLGLLVNKKMLHPPELALESFSGSIILYWGKYQGFISVLRDICKRPDAYEWFEYLYRLSKAYSEAKNTYEGAPEYRPSAKRLFNNLASLFK